MSLKVSLKFQGMEKSQVSNSMPGFREASNQAKEEPCRAYREEMGGQLTKYSKLSN